MLMPNVQARPDSHWRACSRKRKTEDGRHTLQGVVQGHTTTTTCNRHPKGKTVTLLGKQHIQWRVNHAEDLCGLTAAQPSRFGRAQQLGSLPG